MKRPYNQLVEAKTVVIKARTGLKYLSFNVAENHFEGPKVGFSLVGVSAKF